MWDQIFFLEIALCGVVEDGTEARRWSWEGKFGAPSGGGGLRSWVAINGERKKAWGGTQGARRGQGARGPGGSKTPTEVPWGCSPAD